MRPRSPSRVVGLLDGLAPSQDAAGLGGLEVGVAQLGDGRGLAHFQLHSRGIAAPDDYSENSLGLGARQLGRPGRTMPTDGRPALSAVDRPIFDDVAYGVSALTSHTEAADGSLPVIPHDRVLREVGDGPESNHAAGSGFIATR